MPDRQPQRQSYAGQPDRHHDPDDEGHGQLTPEEATDYQVESMGKEQHPRFGLLRYQPFDRLTDVGKIDQ